jgi:hypothetical protein
MGKAVVGTPPETGGAARATARVALAGMALFLGACFISPAAQARPRISCCFRTTVELTGHVEAFYSKVDPTDSQGQYAYTWEGEAHGLAHLTRISDLKELQTDRGVASGRLEETNMVTNLDGPRDGSDPGCSDGDPVLTSDAFEKTRRRYPDLFLGPRGGFSYGNPFVGWELKCGSLDGESFGDLEQGNPDFPSQRQFFDSTSIKRGMSLSAKALAKGRSQKVTCYEHSSPPAQPRRRSVGFFAVTITIVPFPADDLKHQQRRLAAFVGKVPPFHNSRPLDVAQQKFFDGERVPRNGCHTG